MATGLKLRLLVTLLLRIRIICTCILQHSGTVRYLHMNHYLFYKQYCKAGKIIIRILLQSSPKRRKINHKKKIKLFLKKKRKLLIINKEGISKKDEIRKERIL